MWCWSRRWFQPSGLRLSWRGIVLEIARWPVVLWALINVVLRIKHSYMITPKGVGLGRATSRLQVYGPYIMLTLVPLIALWTFALRGGPAPLQHYYGLVLLNSLSGAVLIVVTLILEFRASHTTSTAGLAIVRARIITLGGVALMVCILALTAGIAWHPYLTAALHR
jgi:cellulose synthase (UDP-forming)